MDVVSDLQAPRRKTDLRYPEMHLLQEDSEPLVHAFCFDQHRAGQQSE